MICNLQKVSTFCAVIAMFSLLALSGCGGDSKDAKPSTDSKKKDTPKKDAKAKDGKAAAKQSKVTVAFITNNSSDFWNIAKAGVKKAEAEFNVECRFLMPGSGQPDDQKRIVESLLTDSKVTGMAISPIDSKNQGEMLNAAASKINVICHDSDAPDSKRLCYVGTLNYDAGREAGKLIKEVLPKGGKIMLFVGMADAQNAIERRQGIIDEIKDTEIEIISTMTDQKDSARAKANVEDTLTNHADIGCLVGLWSYNGPAILSAVKDAEKLGKVNIVTFDEEADTLQGVADGHIHATVVQQPYMFGYESVRILGALARGDRSVLPENGINAIPVRVVRKDTVKAFSEELKKLKSGE